jgi:hypothetical protein
MIKFLVFLLIIYAVKIKNIKTQYGYLIDKML